MLTKRYLFVMKAVFLVEQKMRDQILTTLCHNIEATVSTLDLEFTWFQYLDCHFVTIHHNPKMIISTCSIVGQPVVDWQ